MSSQIATPEANPASPRMSITQMTVAPADMADTVGVARLDCAASECLT